MCSIKFRFIGMLVFVLVITGQLVGQDVWEIGVKLGASNYQGDLVREHVNFLETNFSGSVHLRFNYMNGWAFSGHGSFIKISADDRNYTQQQAPGRYERGLKMTNNMMELSGRVEYFPLWKSHPYFENQLFKITKLHPYVAIGLNGVITNLDFMDQNETNGIELADEETLFFAIPFEFGFKYFIHSDFSIGANVVMNRAFSDRLDGYEFSEDADWYLFSGLVFTAVIN